MAGEKIMGRPLGVAPIRSPSFENRPASSGSIVRAPSPETPSGLKRRRPDASPAASGSAAAPRRAGRLSPSPSPSTSTNADALAINPLATQRQGSPNALRFTTAQARVAHGGHVQATARSWGITDASQVLSLEMTAARTHGLAALLHNDRPLAEVLTETGIRTPQCVEWLRNNAAIAYVIGGGSARAAKSAFAFTSPDLLETLETLSASGSGAAKILGGYQKEVVQKQLDFQSSKALGLLDDLALTVRNMPMSVRAQVIAQMATAAGPALDALRKGAHDVDAVANRHHIGQALCVQWLRMQHVIDRVLQGDSLAALAHPLNVPNETQCDLLATLSLLGPAWSRIFQGEAPADVSRALGWQSQPHLETVVAQLQQQHSQAVSELARPAQKGNADDLHVRTFLTGPPPNSPP